MDGVVTRQPASDSGRIARKFIRQLSGLTTRLARICTYLEGPTWTSTETHDNNHNQFSDFHLHSHSCVNSLFQECVPASSGNGKPNTAAHGHSHHRAALERATRSDMPAKSCPSYLFIRP